MTKATTNGNSNGKAAQFPSRFNMPVAYNEAFENLRCDYNAAKVSRFRRSPNGIAPMGSGADFHYRNEVEWLRMMELSRSLDRDDVVVGQGVDRLCENVLGEVGFNLDVLTGDEKVNEDLAARWLDWSEDAFQCDKAGEHTVHELGFLAMRHVVVDGDIFVLPLDEGSLQTIEAHRVRTPRNTSKPVVLGVMLGPQRQREQVWITKDDLNPLRRLERVSDIEKINVRDADGNRQVLQLYLPRRLSQTRGVTAFAPCVDAISMHNDLQFAQLVKAQVASAFAIIHERESTFSGTVPAATGTETTETLADGTTRVNQAVSPGMQIFAQPGEKVTGFSPNIPNPEFFPHAMMILTFIAVNLKIPVQVLLLDPKQTNFSGWRGAMDQARIGFRRLQRWMIRAYYRPVYQWKVRQWIEADPALQRVARTRKVMNNGGILGHRWNPPTWDYIEPKKDAEADALSLRENLLSQRRLQAKRGRDWNEVAGEIVEDHALLIGNALEAVAVLNKKYPEADLNWRDLIGERGTATIPTTEEDAKVEASNNGVNANDQN